MAKAGDGKWRSDARKRNLRLQKRVDQAEMDAFTARALNAGFPDANEYLSAFVRGAVEIDRRERHDMIRILGELGKHGSNLNQLAHAINAGKVSSLSPDDVTKIEAARSAVEKVSEMLREVIHDR